MCKGERKAPTWPTAIIQRPLACETLVRASAVYFFGAMLDGVPPTKRWHPMVRWGLTVCLHTVIKPGIRPCWGPSLTISLLLWSRPARRVNGPNQGFISDLNVTFFCVLWHPLSPLIQIWHQILVTVLLLARSGVLIRGYPPPWTSCANARLGISLTFSNPASTAWSICMLYFCFMWITSQHSSSHTPNCDPLSFFVFVVKHFRGYLYSTRDCVLAAFDEFSCSWS